MDLDPFFELTKASGGGDDKSTKIKKGKKYGRSK